MTQPDFVDLSHIVEDGLITYPGLPSPVICDFISREASRQHYGAGVEFHIGRIDMVANTGTYVDAPFHRYADGKDLSELPLESLASLDTIVIRANHTRGRAIDASAFQGLDFAGKAVLVHTGWSAHWNTEEYLSGHPYLTGDAAVHLREAGAALVGIDSLNIDGTDTGERPVHSELLAHDIPIAEHLTNLAALPDRDTRFFAVPVKVRAFGTFPVRAFAMR